MNRVGLRNFLGWKRAAGGTTPDALKVYEQQQAEAKARAVPSTPLATYFPVYRSQPAGFNTIDVPAGLAIAAGFSAMFGLMRFRFPEDMSCDAMLAGVYGQMVSADVTGTGISGQVAAAAGAGTALPWGDRTGSAACIVIGKRLGITVGSWTSGRVYAPGIELLSGAGPPADTLLIPIGAREDPVLLNFPPGSWGDTTPGLLPVERNTLPMVMRFTKGDVLDVALVVSRTTVNNLANARKICGRCLLQCFLLPLEWTTSMS